MIILILWVYKRRRLSKLKIAKNINFFYAFAADPGSIEIPSDRNMQEVTSSIYTMHIFKAVLFYKQLYKVK